MARSSSAQNAAGARSWRWGCRLRPDLPERLLRGFCFGDLGAGIGADPALPFFVVRVYQRADHLGMREPVRVGELTQPRHLLVRELDRERVSLNGHHSPNCARSASSRALSSWSRRSRFGPQSSGKNQALNSLRAAFWRMTVTFCSSVRMLSVWDIFTLPPSSSLFRSP